MYKVKIATIKEFIESKDTWNKLTLAMNIPSVFCTWEWVYTWWEHFGQKYEPLILFIHKEKELIGIFPLALHKDTGWLTGRIISYCGSNELYPDHLDIICSKENAKQCVNAVFDFLSSDYKDWDVLNISLLSEGSNLMFHVNTNSALTADIKQRSVAPFLAMNGSFDDYLNGFGNKKRYNLKKKHKILCEKHRVGYTSCDPSQITEGIKALFYLHELRAKSKRITSTFRGEQLFNFHNALAERISKNDWLWLRFLKSNSGEIISAFYGFALDGHLFYYQLGLDPEWEAYSPGIVLFYEVLKEVFAKNYKEFDFLRGNEEYKSSWTQNNRALFTINVYNNTLRASFLKKAAQARYLISRAR